MPPFQVNIEADDVNRAVADAIIQSAIGAQVKKTIDNLMEKHWDFQAEITKVVAQEIRNVIQKMLLTDELQGRIKELIREKLTDEMVSQVVVRVFERASRDY